jgi:hypothetical protein
VGLEVTAVPLLAYQGPRMTATYETTGARSSAGSVQITFSFALWSQQETEIVVESIVLAGLSGPDSGYARFAGGTLRPGGKLSGSASISVAATQYEAWQSGRTASLFVYTRAEDGSTRRTRVDAYSSGRGPSGTGP